MLKKTFGSNPNPLPLFVQESLMVLISIQCTFRICKLIFNLAFSLLQGGRKKLLFGMAIQLKQ